MTSVRKAEGKPQSLKKEMKRQGHVNTEAETSMMQLQAKDYQGFLKASKVRTTQRGFANS